ncbi:MAG: hypothetical protein DWQ07_18380 [Chloroflexi bacterium]|nr:MAG: hypothetical protein DWQ07_18380 [Chloroflexota bacterium]
MKRLSMVAMIGIFALLLAACGGGPSGTRPDESGELIVLQIDEAGGMRFEPNEIVLTAGQLVRIVLENEGDKDHEFMIGQNVIRMDDGAANGFEVDFFAGIEDLVQVQLGEGAMLMINDEAVMMDMAMEEEMNMEEGGEMAEGEMTEGEMSEEDMAMEEEEHADDGDEHAEGMGHDGWMVMNAAGSGTTIIEFTVPADRVGEWELGCFEDDGTHYDDGMRGTLVVVQP